MKTIYAVALLIAASLALTTVQADDGIHSAREAKRLFRDTHPCPSTGKISGKCHGYEIDHIKPICTGGAESPANIQWLAKVDAKEKHRLEHQTCGPQTGQAPPAS